MPKQPLRYWTPLWIAVGKMPPLTFGTAPARLHRRLERLQRTGAMGGSMQRFFEALAQLGPAEWFSFSAAVVALGGACVATFAARIEIQDNVDRFIAELAWQSKWNGIAAAVNVFAGALIFVSFALHVLDKFPD